MKKQTLAIGVLSSLLLISFGASAAAPSALQDTVVAREASEGPRGGDNERPGDRHGRGRFMIEQSTTGMQLAREASEGPRGGDNERPGDRHRRGARG